MNNAELIVATLQRAGVERGFGVPARGVRTPEALADALAAALAASGPTVIEAVVDPAHYLETVFD